MAMKRNRQSTSLLLLCAALLSQNLLIPFVTSQVQDQKTYYPPDPNAHPPPTVSHTPPSHGSGGGHATPTPSHGTPTPSHGTPTPSHGTPSHGGGSPTNCGNPPSGGHHHTTPSPPTGGGGGGYYHSPPTTPTTPTPTPVIVSPPAVITPPTTPIDPGTPSIPTIPGVPSIPTIPGVPSIPTIPGITIPPSIPTIPGITIPSPPFVFDPSSPPFTCTYWRNHPTLIWGLFGWLGTVGNAFGAGIGSVPGLGSNTNLLQALSNTRTDGFGELYREGTAALLNSVAHTRFPYSSSQVRDRFVAALSSNKAAAAQARVFKLANEGRAKPQE